MKLNQRQNRLHLEVYHSFGKFWLGVELMFVEKEVDQSVLAKNKLHDPVEVLKVF